MKKTDVTYTCDGCGGERRPSSPIDLPTGWRRITVKTEIHGIDPTDKSDGLICATKRNMLDGDFCEGCAKKLGVGWLALTLKP